MFAQIRYVAFQFEILLRDLLRLFDCVSQLSQALIERRGLFGERTRGRALLINLGNDRVIRGDAWLSNCAAARSRGVAIGAQIPTRIGFDAVKRMSLVHDERIARIDVSTQVVFPQLFIRPKAIGSYGSSDRRWWCRQFVRWVRSARG